MRLMVLAREHGVEPCVAACLQLLSQKVGHDPCDGHPFLASSMCAPQQCPGPHARLQELSCATSLALMSVLEPGCSTHGGVQAAADQLAELCAKRVRKALAADPHLATGDANVQALLLRYLGPLQDMLNEEKKWAFFIKLPFVVLRVCGAGAAPHPGGCGRMSDSLCFLLPS